MKKGLFITLLVVLFTLVSSVAFADPVDLTGQVSTQYRFNNVNGNDGSHNNVTTLILNAKANLAPNFELYARFGAQGVSGPNQNYWSGRNFNSVDYKGNFAADIDQFGFIYKNSGATYTVGRQGLYLGQTGLLYDDTFLIGKHQFVDGVTATDTFGKVNVTGVIAQEDRIGTGTNTDNKIYAISGTYSPFKPLVLGATLADYSVVNGHSTNHYAVSGAYTYDKAVFSAEVAGSSATNRNSAYDYGVNYNVSPKASVFVTKFKVEANGDIGGMTTFDNLTNGEQGLYYGVNYKFASNTNMNILMVNDKSLGDGTKNTSFRGTLTFTF